MWALATMGMRWQELEVRELSDRLLDAVRYNVSRFKAQEITNALWAFATLSVRWKKLETQGLNYRLLDAVHHNTEQLNPQGIVIPCGH
ncbi:DUF1601 domain-containing protein [Coxiella burnetii]|uniref:DUF1601 domain-containing protein n=1 Tax=Coxiella burnetii TaxID=777 RepID=UPI0002E63C51|nr:DUF1601 domain-containing protein [Coxiella burnetii]